ncbi:MAG: phosphoribosyltransferase family protein [Endozoicomonas sp.]
MHPLSEHITSLWKITEVPVDFNAPHLAHYSTMKLGLDRSVAYYSALLSESVEKLMAEHPECQEWVLTAPPYESLPSAANLMMWWINRDLSNRLSEKERLSVVDIHLSGDAIHSSNDFNSYHFYSKGSVRHRIEHRRRLMQTVDDISRHRQRLSGRGIVVVNDIKVSGTQQKFLGEYLGKADPLFVHNLYILELAESIGQQFPQFEYELNKSRIQSLKDFGRVLGAADVHYTARCIGDLFACDVPEFKSLLKALSTDRRLRILKLVRSESRYLGDYFSDKIRILQELCAVEALTNPV